MHQKPKTKQNSWPLIKRVAQGYLAPHRKRLCVSIFCMIIVAIATGLITYTLKPLINGFMSPSDIKNIYSIPGIIVGLFLIKGIANYFQAFLMEYIGQHMIADLQKDLYKKIIHQDLTFFQKQSTAELSARFLFDLNQMKRAITQTVVGISRDGITIFALIGVMFALDAKMALIAFTAFPIAALPIIRFGRKIRRYSTGTQEEIGHLSAILKESFTHNRQVKTYTMEPYETKRATTSIFNVFNLLIKAARVRALSSPIMEMIGGFTIAAIMLYGMTQVQAGNTDPGTFMAFLAAAMSIYRPLKTLSSINNALQEGLAAAKRTFDIMDTASTVQEKESAAELKVKKGSIEFKNVSLTYHDGTEALKNLNLKIKAGQKVALVGASGAGKSTILNLIPRFFEHASGEILIDGQNTQEVTLKSLRSSIGLVTQDIAIFDDTAYNNIAYGSPEGVGSVTDKDIHKSAKSAAAHEFILELENGYHTQLGEEGSKLSGGQKQRIAIARAMLKNAPILLLDEATSSLDTESEKQVQEALNILMKGRTSLIVAHRLSTVVDAHIIHVLEKGEIIESGTHQKLLDKNGAYARLWFLQSGEKS